MKQLTLIIFILSFLSSLAKQDTILVKFDNDRNSAMEYKMIKAANDLFNQFDLYFIQVEKFYGKFTSKQVYVTLTNTETFHQYDYEEEEYTNFAGTCEGSYIDVAKNCNFPIMVFVHEIGHFLGLSHDNSSKDNLMHTSSTNIRLTNEDIRILNSIIFQEILTAEEEEIIERNRVDPRKNDTKYDYYLNKSGRAILKDVDKWYTKQK